ncbi:L-tyrosine/L-tryptophan isonitrile synthase family protein [Chryseobacterium angstadtii]|nr:isocyanide synthase family protein [Chryseobacterium angstadtii]
MIKKNNDYNICSLNSELVYQKAHDILTTIMEFRITEDKKGISCTIPCNSCYQPHIPKIVQAIEKEQPVLFVLPAFPGKSPNPQKVLGSLPDMAERYSLQFLNGLCQSIQKIYAPGARILICSDGRVFSNVIGMKDSDITAYQKEIDSIISRYQLTHISTFHLDQLYEGDNFENMRLELLETFGKPISVLKDKVSRGTEENASREDKEANRMYKGITRFLFEDSIHPEQIKSRAGIQKDAKKRAYRVIQLSNAWSELIASEFPEYVRLSIHPQTCGDIKLGIKLSTENSITPWHGVALNRNGRIVFMKRFEAEKLNARLIYDENGRPDYYEL